MKQKITGKCYVVGDDIDTDQIIPAQYLTYNPAIPEERKMFARLAMIGLPEASRGLPKGAVPFVREGAEKSDYRIIIGGKNFGCGSSREHAPLAIREAGVEVVVAEFFARIFFRNSVNGGYLIPYETGERLCEKFHTGDEVELDVSANTIRNVTQNKTFQLKPLGAILPILEAGDVFEYAKKVGMIKTPAG